MNQQDETKPLLRASVLLANTASAAALYFVLWGIILVFPVRSLVRYDEVHM